MLFDAATPERAAFARTFDVCVIGSGPAGITLARTLAAQGPRCRADGRRAASAPSPESEDIYVGENTGLPYHDLDAARLRFFGGSSGHWNGFCREFDARRLPADARRTPLSGWPISKADLDPYARTTADILDLGPPTPSEASAASRATDFVEIQFRRSAPTRFGEKYLDEITASPRIWLGINANLVDLRLDDALGHVTGAVFKSYDAGGPGLHRRGAALLPLHRRHRERAAAAQLRQPGSRRHRQRPRPGRPLFLRASAPSSSARCSTRIPRCRCRTRSITSSDAFRDAQGTLGLAFRFHRRPRRQMSLLTELARSTECTLPFVATLAREVMGEKAAARCDLGGLMEYRRSLTPDSYPWALATTETSQALNPDSRVMLARQPRRARAAADPAALGSAADRLPLAQGLDARLRPGAGREQHRADPDLRLAARRRRR